MSDEQHRSQERGAAVGQHMPRVEPPATTTMHLAAVGITHAVDGATEISAPTMDVDTLASLRAGTALLRVEHGPNAGARFLLDSDVTTVGRHQNSDIFLDDVTVSRKHAEFQRDGTGFSVRDVGSLNGTYVNRERIDSSALTTGDEVQVGKFRLLVVIGEAG